MKSKSILALLCCLVLMGGCGKPLRVGTKGANYYHREDCPSVLRSWENGGKRVNYYTWWGIKWSGRVPDDKVCHAGTRENPDGNVE